MYKIKDRRSGLLFKEFLPFSGKLDEKNRWIKISSLIPWEELEELYASFFSDRGRSALDGRLVIGLFLLKHMTGLGDEELVKGLSENVYHQAFCGFEEFKCGALLHSTSLTKQRKRLGVKYFRELESRTYKVLIDLKIIKKKGVLCDGTVLNENIKYPNDVGLLNDAREWLVDKIKKYGTRIGKVYRTYCRVARKCYLNFSKKKQKSKKLIKKCKKQMIQYVRRNINQMEEIITVMRENGLVMRKKVEERFSVVKKIFDQQVEMYKKATCKVKDRIVSLHNPLVRPIKRGKNGKTVEFGPKAALSQVDGFLFLDRMSYDNFSEADVDVVKQQLENYEKRFGKLPPSFTGDNLYGSRGNRNLMESLGIRAAFRPLGRRARDSIAKNSIQWNKRKQRERNRIEGGIGTVKAHYGLHRIGYSIDGGGEIWTRSSILGMNLKRALKKI
jgi:hypothetical protein